MVSCYVSSLLCIKWNYNKQLASHAAICNFVSLDALCYAQYMHSSLDVFSYGFKGNDYLLKKYDCN